MNERKVSNYLLEANSEEHQQWVTALMSEWVDWKHHYLINGKVNWESIVIWRNIPALSCLTHHLYHCTPETMHTLLLFPCVSVAIRGIVRLFGANSLFSQGLYQRSYWIGGEGVYQFTTKKWPNSALKFLELSLFRWKFFPQTETKSCTSKSLLRRISFPTLD